MDPTQRQHTRESYRQQLKLKDQIEHCLHTIQTDIPDREWPNLLPLLQRVISGEPLTPQQRRYSVINELAEAVNAYTKNAVIDGEILIMKSLLQKTRDTLHTTLWDKAITYLIRHGMQLTEFSFTKEEELTIIRHMGTITTLGRNGYFPRAFHIATINDVAYLLKLGLPVANIKQPSIFRWWFHRLTKETQEGIIRNKDLIDFSFIEGAGKELLTHLNTLTPSYEDLKNIPGFLIQPRAPAVIFSPRPEITSFLEGLRTPSDLRDKVYPLSLFENIRNTPKLFDHALGQIMYAKNMRSTAQNMEVLISHLQKEEYDPYFWNHPIFQSEYIDSYILLAYLGGFISETTLATAHTLASACKLYKDESYVTIPLFREDGTISELAFSLVSRTMRTNPNEDGEDPTAKLTPDQVRMWFEQMRTHPPSERYLFYVKQKPDEFSLLSDKETYEKRLSRSIQGSVLDRIRNDLYSDMLYTPLVGYRIVPPIGAALAILEATEGREPAYKLGVHNLAFHYGFGTPEIMKQEHLRYQRSISLPASFCPLLTEEDAFSKEEYLHTPMADGYPALGPDMTLHDLLYHVYLMRQTPRDHLSLFMEFATFLEEALPELSSTERELFRQYIPAVIDAEFASYRKDIDPMPSDKLALWFAFLNLLSSTITSALVNYSFSLRESYEEHMSTIGERHLIIETKLLPLLAAFIKKYQSRHPDGCLQINDALLLLEIPELQSDARTQNLVDAVRAG